MAKKLLSAIIAAVMVFSVIASGILAEDVSSDTVFRDVKTNSWYKESVDYVYNNGLMTGVSGYEFAPDAKMSRAMLVTVLWRQEGSPEGFANNFKDVKHGSWYEGAVCWAGENGIVNGISEGVFSANGNITREQMTTILYRYTQFIGSSTGITDSVSSFSDGSKVSGWAKDGMEWAVTQKIIAGIGDGKGNVTLTPAGYATRAQVATILMRYCSNEQFIHSWDEGQKISDPTCTEKGEIVYTCTDCGCEKHVVISALGHEKTQETVTVEPTCYREGNLHFYCTRCEKWIDETLEMTEHTWKAATCTTPKTCTVCGKVSGSALRHSWKAATCTAPKTCTRCGATTGSALGHTDTPKCTRCGRNNRSALISSIKNSVSKQPNGVLLFEDEGDYASGLFVSNKNKLVLEIVEVIDDCTIQYQTTFDDTDNIWYILQFNYTDKNPVYMYGNNNIKRSTLTKGTNKLSYSEIYNLKTEYIEDFKSYSAIYLKYSLDLMNTYLKKNYNCTVHTLGYTNYN